ncbi:hypothetical protein SPRG_21238 [Saprolegnia parasitica CBS 223.65]|uniref:Uncharacterized protein n=1 Tax=Saprolegnia parasitica (strain CBS 223.65) TaxID=695850 RepID=A0A067BUG1_SAPPC|nr:hypothetical protein SPRG_21238 [Saprolegnia parasitica CBS 223.65]KDO21913.1 hypothetical protein SPRG_21238 [Saprolegnia parasitica CBS 223.65]|eukprot:XP_012207389.1 hypothetical protein SPRG_21238 [Saprolegnia parasitica CBS 223.65]
MRTCISCFEKSMTIVDALCPTCTHPQQEGKELKLLHLRLKIALRSAATNGSARDVPAVPRSVLRWLAR